MAVTVGTTKTAERVSESGVTITDENVAHTVDANTTLIVVDVIVQGNWGGANDGDFSVTWDQPTANESLTRVNLPTRVDKTGNDPHIQTWGALSPTAKSANIRLLLSDGTYNNVVCHVTNYLGTSVASLGAAIAFVDDDVNLSDSATCVIGSGGTVGNLLHAVGAWKGTDTDPINLSSGWSGISTKYDDPGGETGDWATHLANKAAASAITFTAAGAGSPENCMAVMLQIAPPVAAGGPRGPLGHPLSGPFGGPI